MISQCVKIIHIFTDSLRGSQTFAYHCIYFILDEFSFWLVFALISIYLWLVLFQFIILFWQFCFNI